MDRQQALAVLNEAAGVMADVYAAGQPGVTREEVYAEMRLQLWEAEKVCYDRGFADAAALHTELSSPTQPS